MLFTSLSFLFVFLPTTLFTYFRLSRFNQMLPCLWLGLMSLLFYSILGGKYVLLLIASIIFNYIISIKIQTAQKNNHVKKWLIAGITLDLLLLGYYKYTNFFIAQYNTIFSTQLSLPSIILPLGISFFTFTQIAFLVDVYRKEVTHYTFIEYLLFVTYFPHLIAGPVIHHKEIIPQFRSPESFKFNRENINIGLSIFIIGLVKKLFLADSFGNYANSVFDHLDPKKTLLFSEAWLAAFAYSFQIYFDFSAYSDMAIGLSKIFGIALPLNFNSPYKAKNIIEFWRRWHITLSRWLRDYLYIPLGGNRCGKFRRFFNLFITMILGGFWHGASWTFIFWGGLHGLYLIINHVWQVLTKKLNFSFVHTFYFKGFSIALTFILVSIAWVFFRANHFNDAFQVIKSMMGLNGFYLPNMEHSFSNFWFALQYINSPMIYIWILIGLIIVWFFPNIAEIFQSYQVCLLTYKEILKSWNHQWAKKLSRIPMRIWYYALLGYFFAFLFGILFYTQNIDATLYSMLPIKLNPDRIENKKGDFRGNLLTTTALNHPYHKILFVGSSYSANLGNFKFSYQGESYQSGSIGIGGNGLVNGFRSILSVLNQPEASKNLKMIVFAISPLGFGNTTHFGSAAFEGQCFYEVNQLGFNFKDNSLGRCGKDRMNWKNSILFFIYPKHSNFYQIHNFFNKLLSFEESPQHVMDLDLSMDNQIKFNRELQNKIVQSQKNRVPVSDPSNGNNQTFQWQSRGIIESIQPNAPIYQAFAQLKQICQQRGIKLIVYDTPTPRHTIDSKVYPPGFLEAYEVAISRMMNDLNIEYYNLIDFFPYNGTFMQDFIHPTSETRPLIHQYLLYQLFGANL